MKRTKNDVILRIQKLSINAGRNEKLIKKWERILINNNAIYLALLNTFLLMRINPSVQLRAMVW